MRLYQKKSLSPALLPGVYLGGGAGSRPCRRNKTNGSGGPGRLIGGHGMQKGGNMYAKYVLRAVCGSWGCRCGP